MGKVPRELQPAVMSEHAYYDLIVSADELPVGHCSEFKFVTENGDWLDVPDSAPNRIESPLKASNFVFNPAQSGRHIFRFQLEQDYQPTGEEYVEWRHPNGIFRRPLPHTQRLLSASSNYPLGANVDPGKSTCFSLFAPRADAVKVFYGRQADGSDAAIVDLSRVNGAVWSVTIDEDLDGCFYAYRVEGRTMEGTSHFDGNFPVLDPPMPRPVWGIEDPELLFRVSGQGKWSKLFKHLPGRI